jgi:hypothetical protein
LHDFLFALFYDWLDVLLRATVLAEGVQKA